MDCTRGAMICFYYNQVIHMKANCSILSIGAVRAPAPSTLRITNGRRGKAKAPVV